jgi:hypothetical protein
VRKLDEQICRDNAVGAHKISLFVRLRTFAASGLSWLLLLAVEKKSLAQKDSRQNHHADAAREDGAKRALAIALNSALQKN